MALDTKEDEVTSTFNSVFYSKRLSDKHLSLEQNILFSYLCDNIKYPTLQRTSYSKAIFASFAKKHLAEHDCIDQLLDINNLAEYDGNHNIEPLVKYCIENIHSTQDLSDKTYLVRDKLHELVPNYTAIMAAELYKHIINNKTLLAHVSKARDADDLKALVFIDYLFYSASEAKIENVLSNGASLEENALMIASRLKPEYIRKHPYQAEIEDRSASAMTESRARYSDLRHRFPAGGLLRRMAITLGLAGLMLTTATYIGCEKKENPHTTNYAVCE